MAWHQFAFRLTVALVLGALVGAERQWRQRTAGLRTNCLVAVGSAMFVMMGGLIRGPDGSQGRVASYVVSGIGFLGGGVILKDGFGIHGLNTAATLWCTAAIGSLAGLGCTSLCFLGTMVVLSANLLLRPLAQRINHVPVQASAEIVYTRSTSDAAPRMNCRFARSCCGTSKELRFLSKHSTAKTRKEQIESERT
jgi:putative Mg2+ transporter-C (MgtC) family protein